MIHEHIRRVAESVEEEVFRVRLPLSVAHENESFVDGDSFDPEWLSAMWGRLFIAKLDLVAARIPPRCRVLDICCGQGYLGQALLESGAETTFCDVSRPQLDALCARLGRRVRTVEADLVRLPFEDGEFDLVIGNSFLHHIQDVPAAVAEVHRVLDGGGRFIMLHEPSARANFWETFPVSLLRDTTYRSGFTDIWQFEAERLAKVLSECGFESVQVLGTGMLSSLLLNWYLISMEKLRVRARWLIQPALGLRPILMRLEKPLRAIIPPNGFPSLLIAAQRS